MCVSEYYSVDQIEVGCFHREIIPQSSNQMSTLQGKEAMSKDMIP